MLWDAYLAGVFDGEGCVLVSRVKTKSRINPVAFAPQLTVVMSDPTPVQRFQLEYGGNIRLCAQRGPTLKPLWRWYINGQGALAAAARLSAFSLNKKPQLLEIQKYPTGSDRANKRVPTPAWMQAKRERIYHELQRLKRIPV